MRSDAFLHAAAKRPVGLLVAMLVMAVLISFPWTPAVAGGEQGQQMPPMGAPAQMEDIGYLQGEWTVDMHLKMSPQADWTPAKGEATVTVELDGCVQRMDFSSEMMGMPFKGIGLDTFNRETGKYESYWIDSMSAHMSKMTGGFEDGKMVLIGEDTNMGRSQMMKSVTEKVSDDEVNFIMSISMDQGKTWFTNMKMIYHRKKS